METTSRGEDEQTNRPQTNPSHVDNINYDEVDENMDTNEGGGDRNGWGLLHAKKDYLPMKIPRMANNSKLQLHHHHQKNLTKSKPPLQRMPRPTLLR